MSQRVPESERVSQSGPEWARESQRTSLREPKTELEGLKVGLGVTLSNLGCQSQPRQSELGNINFPKGFLPIYVTNINFTICFLG